jgi:hypothetical protein
MPPISLIHGAPKCRIARPLGFVPKIVHPIGIEHLAGRRRTGEGLAIGHEASQEPGAPVRWQPCWNAT